MPGQPSLIALRQIRKPELLADSLSAAGIASAPTGAANQDEFDQALLSQVRRLIWGDDPSRHWNDDFIAAGIATLEQLTLGRFRAALCLPADQVGQLVRVSGNSVGGLGQVTVCDVADTTKMPAVGIIVDKPLPTACLVQTFGDLELTGLVPGKRYFVGTNSRLSALAPTASGPGYALVQVVGLAWDMTHLVLNPSFDLIKVRV